MRFKHVFLIILVSLLTHSSDLGKFHIAPKPHKAHSFTAKKFLNLSENMPRRERESLAIQHIIAGHTPSFLNELKAITVNHGDHNLTFWVSPDYMAIGNDSDYLSYPISFYHAVSLANMFGMILPTPKMVDLIYSQADYTLSPIPLPPSKKMSSNLYIAHHNDLIYENFPLTQRYSLVAGHKKDVVLSNELLQSKDRLAIYGWHFNSSDFIQPLSLWHEASYADYSHGIRLVSRQAMLNGRQVDLKTILKNPELSHLISYEGPLNVDKIYDWYQLNN